MKKIGNRFLTVTVSEHGGELMSIKGADGTEYLWQGDPEIWSDRSPNLFPYIGRMKDGTCTVKGKAYHMPIHGLVMYRDLKPEEEEKERISFVLKSDEETLKAYPYHFLYRIRYELEENTLKICLEAENCGEEEMFFALGGHPGLRIPLEEGLAFEDYELTFTDPCMPSRILFGPNCLVDGSEPLYPLKEDKILPLRHELFDEDAIVLRHMCREVTLGSPKGKKGVTMNLADFPLLGFWHMPFTKAGYVCLEPWSSLPSREGVIEELPQKGDLISLKPGEVRQASFMLTFF